MSPVLPPPPFAPPGGRGGAEGGRSGSHVPLTPRTVAVAVCLVLGIGLLGGAGAGALLTGDAGERPGAAQGFDGARTAWRSVPVDTLFPRTLRGKGAGPGGADRNWTRVAVAPDSGCAHAFDPLLAETLSPVGCARLVRATYADETTSSVTTVGLLFTRGDEEAMRKLRKRFASENLTKRTDLMPRPYAARGTVAADFGDAQRASWTISVQQDVPVVVYSVSGFADGRVVSDPQPAADAVRKGETTAAAQAGLGHDAQGIADRIEQALRRATSGDEAPGNGLRRPGGDGTGGGERRPDSAGDTAGDAARDTAGDAARGTARDTVGGTARGSAGGTARDTVGNSAGNTVAGERKREAGR
ncbi:hypothetical protein [Streptomyces cacaoi]|uniref:hypothetical protein n=1 Tax=Streptomyces cacaoi TaxID=1898 RepID=UPI0016594809|nr:hypothetical protein [Streptomyces cacaoi]